MHFSVNLMLFFLIVCVTIGSYLFVTIQINRQLNVTISMDDPAHCIRLIVEL